MNELNVCIVVATHKPSLMPSDGIYLPIHVGKELHPDIDLGFIGDNTGGNISLLNATLNELTAVYWAWKNIDADYIGLAHYRRHFCSTKKGNRWNRVLNGEEAMVLLQDTDIVIPKKRWYIIETLESHFYNTPYAVNSDLACMRKVISENHPKYLAAFDKVMKRRWGHMFNMFIMKKSLFDEYCTFLFDVTLEVDARIDTRGRSAIEARMYTSEFLLDTWLEAKGYPYKEAAVQYMEKQNIMKKYMVFVLRKFGFSGEVKAS